MAKKFGPGLEPRACAPLCPYRPSARPTPSRVWRWPLLRGRGRASTCRTGARGRHGVGAVDARDAHARRLQHLEASLALAWLGHTGWGLEDVHIAREPLGPPAVASTGLPSPQPSARMPYTHARRVVRECVPTRASPACLVGASPRTYARGRTGACGHARASARAPAPRAQEPLRATACGRVL